MLPWILTPLALGALGGGAYTLAKRRKHTSHAAAPAGQTPPEPPAGGASSLFNPPTH